MRTYTEEQVKEVISSIEHLAEESHTFYEKTGNEKGAAGAYQKSAQLLWFLLRSPREKGSCACGMPEEECLEPNCI